MEKANSNESTRKRVAPPDDVLATMTKAELRQRRRVGVDTARQQRRATARYKAGKRA